MLGDIRGHLDTEAEAADIVRRSGYAPAEVVGALDLACRLFGRGRVYELPRSSLGARSASHGNAERGRLIVVASELSPREKALAIFHEIARDHLLRRGVAPSESDCASIAAALAMPRERFRRAWFRFAANRERLCAEFGVPELALLARFAELFTTPTRRRTIPIGPHAPPRRTLIELAVCGDPPRVVRIRPRAPFPEMLTAPSA